MPRYILTGDVVHAGRVIVEATTEEEAIKKAEAGDFKVYEEVSKGLTFQFDGQPEHIEVHPSDKK